MKKIAIALGMGVLLVFGGTATAHPDHDDMKPMVQPKVALEAKATSGGASVAATRDGSAVQTAGATGTLTIMNGSRKQVVQLKPAGANMMEAKTKAAIAPGTKARAAVTFADKTSADADVVIN